MTSGNQTRNFLFKWWMFPLARASLVLGLEPESPFRMMTNLSDSKTFGTQFQRAVEAFMSKFNFSKEIRGKLEW